MCHPLIQVTYTSEIKAGYTGATSHSVNVSSSGSTKLIVLFSYQKNRDGGEIHAVLQRTALRNAEQVHWVSNLETTLRSHFIRVFFLHPWSASERLTRTHTKKKKKRGLP